MNHFASAFARLIAAASVLSLGGCFVSDDHPPHSRGAIVASSDVPDGSLIVDWTIDHSKDRFACSDIDADQISVELYDDAGFFGEFAADCESFATTIDLPPGPYSGDALLLDSRGAELTTAVDLGDFSIHPNADSVIPIDFPLRSIR